MKPEQSKQIEQLYLEMYEMLFTYACCSLEEKALAEEVVQETFQIACQKPEQLCKSPNPKGWLVNTLKNTIRNKRRKREDARQLLSIYWETRTRNAAFTENELNLEVMYENIADTEEFKMIKELAVDGKSHLEMANDRGITVSACKKRVQRAKEFLQKKLKIYVTK